ncbi:hypothetical protein SUGI_1135450 [Cryptomeria japonica]|nr:hypothetical protein SUGI_1135450 [Cryptomeria japonica]
MDRKCQWPYCTVEAQDRLDSLGLGIRWKMVQSCQISGETTSIFYRTKGNKITFELGLGIYAAEQHCHTPAVKGFLFNNINPYSLSTRKSLCDVFTTAGWDIVEHYKIAKHCGLAVTFRWKHPSEWPPRGSKGNRHELAQLLASRACNSLRDSGVLAWAGSDVSEKYSVCAGYKQLDMQLFGEIEVPWWKQV